MANRLSKKEVEKIARLARMELSEEEIGVYSEQLSDILSYVSQLQEVNTDNVPITSQVTGLSNVLREDEVFSYPDPKALVKLAPEKEGDLIKVKSVFE